ncbi:extracellular solute-binding protein [Telmatospirillum siberiense]|uniref:ABC transporter substrate-binding protein n=1 Tax=Telmatospirillum siberiense TaxID=382514 RepID=A0A2N3PUY0_9PROT|nr:extracellular solute-binding protein [Telmatospirillum siberiense]PKU24200.1 ABC transporter substrate-binding protein [Telmatospirillum siberiense]
MSLPVISRRNLLRFAGAATLAFAAPQVRAAGGHVTATTFPGAWEEAHRRFLLPAVQSATGMEVTLTASQAVDTVTKLAAAQSNPPFDVVMMDEGPFLQGVGLGLFRPMVAGAVPNLASLPTRFVHPEGLGAYVSAQVFGIAYNKERISTPPAAWEDLLSPAFKGRVGLVGLDSTLGTVWMVALAKMLGGDEDHMDPAFDFIAKLLPNVGAVAANPGALGTLFQSGQIDISCHYLNNVASLAAKDVPVALTRPASGWGLVRSLMCVTKNTAVPDLASAYINVALSEPVQRQMAGAPYYLAPTNSKVAFGSEMALIAKNAGEIDQFVQTDWMKINPRRAEYIDRFNRLVKR